MKPTNSGRDIQVAKKRFSACRLRVAPILIAILLLSTGLFGQTASTGALSGTVTDSSGAVVAGASVKVTSEVACESRTVSTEHDGSFLAPLLLPGKYRLEVGSKGFKTLVRTGVQVFVTEKEEVRMTLNVGTPTETVEVAAEGEALKTEDSTLGNVTEGEAVRELPLVNRNYTQIVGLSPGVIADVNNASDLGRGNSGLNSTDGGFSSHGGATNDNNYQMNGAQVNDLMAAGNFSGGVPIPNPDAIQEFKVQTGQYDASYGRNGGANVNLITKSGTNELHGTIFEFVRNDIFNANDYFLNRAGKTRASLKQNQFGFTLGGPIVKDKLFAFGSYQGTRQINGLDSTAACLSTFFTPTELAGLPDRSRSSLGAAFQGQTSLLGDAVAADGSNIAPEAINLLNLTLADGSYLIPSPQNTTTGQSTITQNCFYNADQFLTDVDYDQTDRSKLSGRFFFEDGNQNATFPQSFAPMLKGFGQPVHTSFRNFSLTHTYTFSPRMLNQIVVSYNRLNNLLAQTEPQVQVQGQSGLVPFSYSAIGATAPPLDDQYPGIGVLGQFDLGGNGQGTSLIQNHYNVDDTVSYSRGRHSLRFGGGLSRQQINFEGFHFLGLSAFFNMADLLLGHVIESEDFVGEPDRSWRAWNGDLYGQDDFKATNRLTFNVGLRYERQGLIGDALGRASIFDITRANPNPPAAGMHSRQFANLPDMNGMCLGFYEETRNGHRIIGHGGDTQYFHSDLHLIPDAQVGFFVSYNSAGKGEIRGREAVWHAFLDRYFPIQLKDEPAAATAAQDAQIVSGHYISSRRSETNILAVLNVAGEAKIFRNGDGTISASDFKDVSGQPRKFREIGPMMFRDVNDQDRIGFKRDDSGNLVGVVDFPFLVVQRASWWENSAFQLPLIVVSLVIIVLAVVLWPVMALLRKHYAKPLNLTPQQRRLRLLVRLVCIAFIIFFAAYVTFFMVALKDIGMLSPKGNPWLRLIQLFGWLGVLGTLVALYNAMLSWQDSARWLWSKIGDTLIALACVGVICFVFTWHMLHWRLKY